VLARFRFRRFSAVQLLIALALFFIWAPFVEEIEGGRTHRIRLFSLVCLLAVVGRSQIATRPGHRDRACDSGDRRQVDKSFRPDLIPPAVFLVAGLILIAFVSEICCASSSCAVGQH